MESFVSNGPDSALVLNCGSPDTWGVAEFQKALIDIYKSI